LFKSVVLNLDNGKKVTIKASDNDKSKRYVSSMTVNGKNHTKNYITHKILTEGADINYKMSETPNTKRGTDKNDFPYSFSNEIE
ncbi:MAG: glycoside hydrolase family 92 protein, partial [Prevotellaceae bacterium]|nr:glycoside hydrolase family 92 protein [Prevotellaceae bacterium]